MAVKILSYNLFLNTMPSYDSVEVVQFFCYEDVAETAIQQSSAKSWSTGVVFMSGDITYDGHISKPGITELKVGSSENWYSRVR